MKADAARAGRIAKLFDQALRGKFQVAGAFSYTALVMQAKMIGVTRVTAEDYADDVIVRLKKCGALK